MTWPRETFKKIKQIPREEHVLPGTALCAGCGGLESLRLAAKVLGDDVGQEIGRHDAFLAVGALELELHVDAGGAGVALDQHQVGAVGPQDRSGFVHGSGDRLVGQHGSQSRFGA